TQLGANRTGMDISPLDGKQMVKGAKEYSPKSQLHGRMMSELERPYLESAEPVGSVPMPGTLKGALKTTRQKMAGHNPEVFINKLGERLAYERSGVRLYECFIRKVETLNGSAHTAVPMKELKHICKEEAEHFRILKESMESLGADPTAQTPDADVSGVAAMGLMKVIQDPRTSISQCLEALLTIELTDNAAWETLIMLAESMGLSELRERFEHCLLQEQEHLRLIKGWYEESLSAQAMKAPKSSKQTRH